MAERDSGGAAKRRRERRWRISLRCVWSWPQWRTTRTAPHGDRRQPPGPGTQRHGDRSLLCPQSPQARSTSRWTMRACRRRGRGPAALLEPRLQGRVQQHTVEHIIDVLPNVQILDVPVPQMGDQLVEFMQRLDTATSVQVTAVPKISLDRIPQRFVDQRRPQRAEQLVEVPTVVSFPLSNSSLQSRSVTFQNLVVVLEVVEVFKGFSQHRI